MSNSEKIARARASLRAYGYRLPDEHQQADDEHQADDDTTYTPTLF